jgi:hypothetical protein
MLTKFWSDSQALSEFNYIFCWPCVSINPCNENQLDALFIFCLFRQSTSTCFGHICSPSSGGILYICNNFLVYYPDVCLQRNMFWEFSRPSSEAQWVQWQPLVLPSYRGDSRNVFVVGPAGPTTNTSDWWFILIVRWYTDLQTLNFTFKF